MRSGWARTNPALMVIAGVGIGAGTSYLLDRDSGRRRRSVLFNRIKHNVVRTRKALSSASADLVHRSAGVTAHLAKSTLGRTPDEILVARIRSHLGRLVGHPHAIMVEANQGRVVLSGAILAREVDPLIADTRRIPGIMDVENRLSVHLLAEDAEPLRGPGRHLRRRRPGYWSPATRLVGGSVGGLLALAGLGLRRRGVALSVLGGGLLARSISNWTLGRIIGVDRRGGIELRKSITLEAPIEDVFPFLDNVQNLNQFMANVRDVKDLGDGRSRWVLAGPGGVSITWDAVQIRREPNVALAWASVPGAAVGSALWIRFAPDGDQATRLDIQLIYNPLGGILGYVFGKLLGMDPKRALDRDLVRLKSLVEIGKTTVHGHVVLREGIEAQGQTTLH